MQKTRFTEEQMVTILREADQRPVPEVAKKHGVSSQTIYAWRKHFGSLEPTDIKRLRQLEQENGRLKKMVADRDLEIDVLKEITRKNGRRTPAPAARSRMHARAGCQAAGRAPCSSSPGRHSATNRVWWPGTPCRWPPCVGWRRSIRATDIAGFESS